MKQRKQDKPLVIKRQTKYYDKIVSMPKERKRKWSTDQLLFAVANNYSYASVLKELGLKPTGGNYAQLKKHIKAYELDASHFTGQSTNAGKKMPSRWVNVESKLTRNSEWNTNALRQQLIRAEIFKHECSGCFNDMWMGSPIPLELDHIDGDRTNNLIDNLRVLCPNCHALTDTYRGKNIGK